MPYFNIVAATSESTVVTEYEPQTKRSDAYQSEAALEKAFIKMLTEQGYEYITIHDEAALIQNLRTQLERLNQFSFTDKEWDRFFKDKIANQNEGIVEKTRKIQEDHVQNLTREDGTTMNISLIDKKNIHNNRFVYEAIGNWRWMNSGESSSQPSGTYEQVLLDYYNQHGICWGTNISAPGSNDTVSTSSSYECLGKVLKSMV